MVYLSYHSLRRGCRCPCTCRSLPPTLWAISSGPENSAGTPHSGPNSLADKPRGRRMADAAARSCGTWCYLFVGWSRTRSLSRRCSCGTWCYLFVGWSRTRSLSRRCSCGTWCYRFVGWSRTRSLSRRCSCGTWCCRSWCWTRTRSPSRRCSCGTWCYRFVGWSRTRSLSSRASDSARDRGRDAQGYDRQKQSLRHRSPPLN